MVRSATMRAALVTLVVLLLAPAPAEAQRGLAWSHHLTGPRAAERLRSSEPEERRLAADELGRHGELEGAVTVLIDALPADRDPEVRRAIVGALARRGDLRAVPVLAEALASGHDPSRDDVAAALGAIGNGAAVAALVTALGSEETAVAAREALARIGAPAVPVLLRALGEAVAAAHAAWALGRIGEPRAVPHLVALTRQEGENERAESVTALGLIGDPRGAPAVAARLGDESPRIVAAAMEALARVGGAAELPLLRELAGRGAHPQRRLALSAMLAIDPAATAPDLTEAITSDDPALVRIAADLALGSTHPALVPILYGLLREGTRSAEAASALAEVEAGAGLAVLLEEAQTEGPGRPHARRELAVALRRHHDLVARGDRERALAILAEDGSPGGLLLRALARDGRVDGVLVAGLAAEEPSERAVGALGLALLGAHGRRGELGAALATESDPEAFRREASALLALGGSASPRSLASHLTDPETAPEAMVLAAASIDRAGPRQALELRRLFRRALRTGSPRERAGAARALATAGDRDAWRALVAALDDDDADVRRAVARALEMLAVPESVAPILAAARVEPDARLRQALADASDAPARRPLLSFAARGEQVLRVRIVAVAGVAAEGGIPVDVVLADGTWQRLRTLPDGQLILADLPSGEADIRIGVAL